MNVLVYNGQGVSQTSLAHTLSALRALTHPHLSVRTVSAATLAKQPWAPTCALLVLPGGRDLPYITALSEHTPSANDAIKSYVARGGRFLGICAGAYYASRAIQWETGRPGFEVSGERPLAFYPGTSTGCVFPGFEYQSERGARIVRLALEDQDGAEPVDVYYNGGGEFVDAEALAADGVRVVARYTQDGAQGKVAAVSCRVGQGTALLWACHPEYPLVAEPCTTVIAEGRDYELGLSAEKLAAAESRRWTFLRASLTQLGIRVGEPTAPLVPSAPLPYVLASSSDAYTKRVADALAPLLNENGMLRDRHNAVHFRQPSSSAQLAALIEDARSNPNPLPAAPPEETSAEDEDKIPVYLAASNLDQVRDEHTPCFSVQRYFKSLATHRRSTPSSGWGLGDVLLYSEAVESTQTLLDKNPALCAALPAPLVALATHQLAGRGRGGNAWVSPRGSLMFSALLRVSLAALPAQRLALVQYLFSIAVVEACRAVLPDDARSTVRIKWPNDIYAAPEEGDIFDPKVTRKLGGVLVSTNFRGGEVDLIIGSGLNVLNDLPTTSLVSLAPNASALRETLRIEDLAASLLTRFDTLFAEFIAARGSFEPFMVRYLRYWLHSDQEVTITTTDPPTRVRIAGLSPDYGLLRTVPVDKASAPQSSNPFARDAGYIDLQPDGNSFNMFAGLIRLKG